MTQIKRNCLYESFWIVWLSTSALTLVLVLNYGVMSKEKSRYSVFAAVPFGELNRIQVRNDSCCLKYYFRGDIFPCQ